MVSKISRYIRKGDDSGRRYVVAHECDLLCYGCGFGREVDDSVGTVIGTDISEVTRELRPGGISTSTTDFQIWQRSEERVGTLEIIGAR